MVYTFKQGEKNQMFSITEVLKVWAVFLLFIDIIEHGTLNKGKRAKRQPMGN